MADINVGYDALLQGRRDLVNGRNEISQKVAELMREINILTVEGGFTTRVASAAYNRGFEEWVKGIHRATEGATEMSDHLLKVMQSHQDLDNELGAGGFGR